MMTKKRGQRALTGAIAFYQASASRPALRLPVLAELLGVHQGSHRAARLHAWFVDGPPAAHALPPLGILGHRPRAEPGCDGERSSMISTLTPILGENSLFKSVGEIFHPVFVLFGTILAGIYAVVPNYAIAIAILTIIVMGVLTPLTVKSTKSMIAMQELQPEIKKLQQKYKGAENREELNREMMRLYKEKGVNPAGGCVPMLLQMPFLIVLYDLIRGITATTTVNGQVKAEPKYISHSSSMYHALVASHGQMVAFGMNLADRPFSHHPSIWAAIPFFVLVLVAVGLQYFQMSQMTRRNPAAAQANKQMQTMQKVMPLLMAYIYFLVPAAVVIYMIVSTVIRIGTQDVIFRMGIVKPARVERTLPAGAGAGGGGASGGRNGSQAKGAPAPLPAGTAALTDGAAASKSRSSPQKGNGNKGNGVGSNGASSRSPGGGSARRPSGSSNRRRPPPEPATPKPHPRSKSKRTRKAR